MIIIVETVLHKLNHTCIQQTIFAMHLICRCVYLLQPGYPIFDAGCEG